MKRLREPQEDTGSSPPEQDAGSTTERGVALQPPSKISELDPSHEDGSQDEPTAMRCSLPPHRNSIAFSSYGDFELHYHAFHTHRCLECHKNFPSNHILGIHIEECHDPLVGIQRDRGGHTVSPWRDPISADFPTQHSAVLVLRRGV